MQVMGKKPNGKSQINSNMKYPHVTNVSKITLLGALSAGILTARADEPFFQASLTPDIAIYPRSTEIEGFAINIWGENPQHSLNLGFLNGSTGNSGGVSLGLVNYSDAYTGVMFGLANVSQREFTGLQGGFVNYSQESLSGVQYGFLNVAQGECVGAQVGGVNYAEEFHGLQLGLVNCAENLRGLQIGFVNVALNNSWFDEFPDKLATAFPIVNWSF